MKQTRLSGESVNIRSEEDGGNVVEGYASVFNKRSRLISEKGKVFYEVILNGAFDEVLMSDKLNCIANFQHKDENMLARTKSGTLTLSVDDYGLKYVFTAPNTSLGNDIVEWLHRGDINESSFRYSVKASDVNWGRAEDGTAIRYIKRIFKLSDVALVLNGAFADTDVALRELQEFEDKEEAERQAKEQERKQELEAYFNNLEKRIR